MRYIERVHTPGFEAPPPHAYAPEDCFLIHFNTIVRSSSERVAKLRKYASLDEKLAWRFVDENLPELTDPAIHNYASDGLGEFSSLLESLPSLANGAPYELTERERMLMAQGTQEWLAESARAMQETMCMMQEAILTEKEATWLRFLPRPLLRPLAEFLLTVGRRVNSRGISQIGLRAWSFQKLRSAA